MRPPGDAAPYDSVSEGQRCAACPPACLPAVLAACMSARLAVCGPPSALPPSSALRPPALLRAQSTPDLVIEDPALGHALWSVYLNPASNNPAPEARKAWLAGLQALGK